MKNTLSLLIFLLISIGMMAQLSNKSYDVSFGEPSQIMGKEKIKTTAIIAETKDRLYMVLSDETSDFRNNYGKLKIQSIDKQSLNPIKTVDVWQELSNGKPQKLNDILVTSKGLLVVSEGYSDGMSHVYVEQLDFDLYVMGFSQKVNDFDRNMAKCRVIKGPNYNEFVVITQNSVKGGENMFVDYKLYDENVQLIKEGALDMGISGEVKTGLFARNTKYNIIHRFTYTSHGEMVYMSWIYDESREEGEYKLIFANPKEGTVEKVPVMNNNEGYVGEYSMLVVDDEIIITGLYGTDASDWRSWRSSKAAPGISTFNGSFIQRFDARKREVIRTVLSPFSQDILNQLPRSNPALKVGVLFGKKSRESEQNDVSGRYDIQKVVYSPEDKKATFYLEYVYNSMYTTTTTSGPNGAMSTSTTYTSKRGNIFYYQINLENGSINWYNTVRKHSYYSSGSSYVWDIQSLFVIPRSEGDMMLYNSDRIFNENDSEDLTGEKIKTKKLEQNYFLSSINGSDGSFYTELPRLTNDDLKPYEKIQMDRSYVSDMDRSCYTINSQYKYRPELVTLWCATMPFCFAGYFLYAFGRKHAFNETYTIGRMTF